MIPALASTVLLALSLSPLAVREPALPEGLSAADMSCIRSAYDARRHAAVQVEGGYEASNAGQRWWTTFDGEGVTVEPDSAQWTWGLELVRWGFAEAELAVESALVVRADGQRVSYEWGEGLEEWYVNDRRGLEHGYTVLERPPGDGGELAITLAVRGALVLEPTDDGRGARFVTRDGVAVLTYGGLVVRDADGRELEARIERAGANLRISLDEDTARYPITIDPVAQQAYLKASNAKQGDQFGRDVAVSGDTVVVGAPWAGGSEGKAYVFVRSGATWTEEAVLQASNGTGEDLFGWWPGLREKRTKLLEAAGEPVGERSRVDIGAIGQQNAEWSTLRLFRNTSHQDSYNLRRLRGPGHGRHAGTSDAYETGGLLRFGHAQAGGVQLESYPRRRGPRYLLALVPLTRDGPLEVGPGDGGKFPAPKRLCLGQTEFLEGGRVRGSRLEPLTGRPL